MKKLNICLVVIAKFVSLFTLLVGASGFLGMECNKRGHNNEQHQSKSKLFSIESLDTVKNLIPILIIGSGPAGLTAAVHTAPEMNTVIIQGNEPGGLLMGTTDVENWSGHRSITGPKLIAELEKHAQERGAEFLLDSVVDVQFDQWPYTIKTENGLVLKALAVLVCTGAAPKRLGVVGEDEHWGAGVSSCAVCDAIFFKGKDVVVVGGGDAAVEEAMQLARHVKSVKVLVRKDKMRAATSMQARLSGYPNVSVIYNTSIKKINGTDNKVTNIEIIDNTQLVTSTMPISGVFLAIGQKPNTVLFEGKLPMDAEGYLSMKGRSQETGVPGVFAAGDVQDRTYRQAKVAAGDGTKAAIDAINFLRSIGFDVEANRRLKKNFFTTLVE